MSMKVSTIKREKVKLNKKLLTDIDMIGNTHWLMVFCR